MDKKMKRQILFKATTAPKSKALKKVEQSPQETKDVYKWLQSRPLLNLNGICLKVGVDRANFAKSMKANRPLKKEIMAKLLEELKLYGYAE